MRAYSKCAYFIVCMTLIILYVFTFFESPKSKIIEIKDVTLSKNESVLNELSNIQNYILFVDTSLNIGHNTTVTYKMSDKSDATTVAYTMSDSDTTTAAYTMSDVSDTTTVAYALSDFLKEQYRRRDHIHSSCEKIDTRLLRNSLTNLIADRQHHLTFCPVYKASSTSWLITLLQLNGKWKDGELENLQDTLKRTFSKIYKFDDLALSKKSQRFLIVRHPFERLVSCFRDKFEVAKKGYYYGRYGENIVRKYRLIPKRHKKNMEALLRDVMAYVKSPLFKTDTSLPSSLDDNPYASPIGPTFAEFTRFVLESTQEDEHWKPMSKWCSLCKIDYNIILKFENLYSESQEFIEYLNYSSILKTRWDNPTKGGKTSEDRTCDYFKQLQIHTVNGLIKKFSNDLLLFQYSPDKYLKCAENK